MEDRVPVFEICRYIAFAAFLKHGRPSVGLAPTIVWDCILVSASVFTVALPATKQMLKGKLRSVEVGKDWRSDATRNRQQSPRKLEAQVPARQKPAELSIDLSLRTAEDTQPVSQPRPSSSSAAGSDNMYDGYRLRGMPSYRSTDRILGPRSQTSNLELEFSPFEN
jgi:hypothetical protein